MKILAVEFSSARRSVAVWEDSVAGAPGALLAGAMETGGRRSLGLVEQALAEADCQWEEIGVVAVGLGPGSYTGIRGAIAMAQGWQLGRNIPVLGVSSIACLAAQAAADGWRGPVNIIVDAQRNEFYLARYELNPDGPRAAEPLRLAALPEIQALAAAGGALLGPDLAKWFSGAKELYPDAAMLGQLACGRRDFVPGENLEPIYLRETAFKKAAPPRTQV